MLPAVICLNNDRFEIASRRISLVQRAAFSPYSPRCLEGVMHDAQGEIIRKIASLL